MGRLRDARALLAAHDEAARQPDVARPAVLVAADQGTTVDDALDLTLADCAAKAIAAHVDAFGPHADCACTCHECGEQLRVPLDLRHLGGTRPDAGWPAAEKVRLADGSSLTVHPLTTRQLLDAGRWPDARVAVLRACLTDANGPPLSAESLAALGPGDLAAVDGAADRLAGPASAVLRMVCPGCGAVVRAPADAGSLLWERVAATVPLLLVEVAALARAFGWSEGDILSLGSARRRAYLRLIGAWDDAPDPLGLSR